MPAHDVAILGGGIAGASLAWHLAHRGLSVLLVEREEHPGYHATGRSAAIFVGSYGGPVARILSRGSRPFLQEPPSGFCDGPLGHNRRLLFLATSGDEAAIAVRRQEIEETGAISHRLTADQLRTIIPILRTDVDWVGLEEEGTFDIDVDHLHQGFLRGAQSGGAVIRTGIVPAFMRRTDGGWTLVLEGATVDVRVLVNAAGAWADAVAVAAGAAPLGLSPRRRSACLVAPPPGLPITDWPMVVDIAERFYFKPEAGKLLISPADATPSPPCDAQPDELDLAIGVDAAQQAIDIPVRRIEHRWAGLRTFSPDGHIVIGHDAVLPDFFWLAGQGGFGIQTAPAAGRVAASLLLGDGIPDDLAALGLTAEAITPRRFAVNPPASRGEGFGEAGR